MSAHIYRYYDDWARQLADGPRHTPPGDGHVPSDIPLLRAIDWGAYLPGAGQSGTLKIQVYFAGGDIGVTTLDGVRVSPDSWSAYEINQVKDALDVIEGYIDVDFVETSNAASADLTFMIDDAAVQYGMKGMFMPQGSAQHAGHGIFFRSGAGWDMDRAGGLEPGGAGFTTILHETLHGLGLAHPHDEGGASEIIQGFSGSAYENTADYGLNQAVYTVMSLVDGWAAGPLAAKMTTISGHVASPSPIDIGLLQDVYGAAKAGAGDDLYLLGGQSFYAIWDVGGADEISAQGLSEGVTINLNAASLNYESGGGGVVSYVDGDVGGLTIASGVVIENATGGNGADALTGNSANNILTGGGGKDSFAVQSGGGHDVIADFEVGVDTVKLPAATAADFSALSERMQQSGGDVIISVDADTSVTLKNVSLESLSAADFGMADSQKSVQGAAEIHIPNLPAFDTEPLPSWELGVVALLSSFARIFLP